MANIEDELWTIRSSKIGSEIKQAIYNALNTLNNTNTILDAIYEAEQSKDISVGNILTLRETMTGIALDIEYLKPFIEKSKEVFPNHESRLANLDGKLDGASRNIGNVDGALRSVTEGNDSWKTTKSCTITYMSWDGSETLGTQTVDSGQNGTLENTSTRPNKKGKSYVACGWSRYKDSIVMVEDPNVIARVQSDLTVYAAFKAISGTGYIIKYVGFNASDVIATFSDQAYGDPTPLPDELLYENLTDSDGKPFSHWTPTWQDTVSGDVTYQATSGDEEEKLYVKINYYSYNASTLLNSERVAVGEDGTIANKQQREPDNSTTPITYYYPAGWSTNQNTVYNEFRNDISPVLVKPKKNMAVYAAFSTVPVTPTHIKVTTPPTKTTYNNGENIDFTGIVVTAYTNNGTSDVLYDTAETPNGIVPFNQLQFPITKARSATDDGSDSVYNNSDGANGSVTTQNASVGQDGISMDTSGNSSSVTLDQIVNMSDYDNIHIKYSSNETGVREQDVDVSNVTGNKKIQVVYNKT